MFCTITVTQHLIFIGLEYGSPILVCAMGHLVCPNLLFPPRHNPHVLTTPNRVWSLTSWNIFHIRSKRQITGVKFCLCHSRTTRLDLKNPSFPVKLLGTFITVVGAVFVTLYKSTALFHLEQYLFVFASMPEWWDIGRILSGCHLKRSRISTAWAYISFWPWASCSNLNSWPWVKYICFVIGLGGLDQKVIFFFCTRNCWPWLRRSSLGGVNYTRFSPYPTS